MKRLTVVFFCIMIAALAVVAFFYSSSVGNDNSYQPADHQKQTSRTIIPAANMESSHTNSEQQMHTNGIDDFSVRVPLQPAEIPIQYLQYDFNQDGTDDVIAAVKKLGEPCISIVPFELNPLVQSFTRMETIQTTIVNAETFSFYELDVIGERTMALITSGVTANNERTLQIHLPQMIDEGTIFLTIGDFTTDGTITIRRTERSEAYSLGQTYGESFPVYIQSSDPDTPQSLDQIERIYRWSRENFRFDLVSETKIPGKNVEARYIQQLRQGSVSEFESFLNGLWYKPDSANNGGPQYLQISTAEREIIFFFNNTQEVYRWDGSSPTRLGLYITTVNTSVSNLRRLIDIKLAGIDEVSVRIMEDVKMKITVDSSWNGSYRKLGTITSTNSSSTNNEKKLAEVLCTESDKPWITEDGQQLSLSGSSYTLSGSQTKSGRFSCMTLAGAAILMIKDQTDGISKSFVYTLANVTESAEKKTSRKIPDDDTRILETLTLVPVYLTAESFKPTGDAILTFTR